MLAFSVPVDLDDPELGAIWKVSVKTLVSASTGEMAKRYGFVFVEKYDDGTGDNGRKKKDSFDWYKKVIASNGEDLD